MSAQSNAAPVIIKRKKVVSGGGHHGGAWKVAYADFVTAMMAFFLLMWLLNATTEKQRKGLADYFSPTIPISRISGGGDGDFGGESVFSEDTLPKNGTGAAREKATESNRARGESGVSSAATPDTIAASDNSEQEAMKQAFDAALSGLTGESMVAPELLRHIMTRVTDEGLIVEIFDIEGAPLFVVGQDAPTPILNDLMTILTELGRLVTNAVAIEAHTRAAPWVLKNNPVWDLSTARANRTRISLQSTGFDPARINRVTGYADREPAVRDPMAIRNNRLEIIFLRSEKGKE